MEKQYIWLHDNPDGLFIAEKITVELANKIYRQWHANAIDLRLADRGLVVFPLGNCSTEHIAVI